MEKELKTEIVPIETIIPYARNPRDNSRAVDYVAASLKEFGWQQPIVVDEENIIIAGHTRLEAARKLGLKEVPIWVAKDLTPQQVKAYRIADNKIATYSAFDDELLTLEFKDLVDGEYDILNTGFTEGEINFLLETAEFSSEGLAQDLPEPLIFGETEKNEHFSLVYDTEEEKDFWCAKLGIDGHKKIWTPEEAGFGKEVNDEEEMV